MSFPLLPQNSIRSVDFRNFTYESGMSADRIILRNGIFLKGAPPLQNKSRIVSLRYVDLNEDGKQEAAIVIHTDVVGSMGFAREYYVFEYREDQVRQVFHEWREQGGAMHIKANRLTIIAPFWADADAHCCPSYTETKVYEWRSGQFISVSRKMRKDYPNQQLR
jgi:hypothetical protein